MCRKKEKLKKWFEAIAEISRRARACVCVCVCVCVRERERQRERERERARKETQYDLVGRLAWPRIVSDWEDVTEVM